MWYNYLQALFNIGTRQPEQQPSLKTPQPQIIKATTIPLLFRDDVEKLKTYVGDDNWKPGLTIELELRDLLSICPRERRRSDAFKKLIDYLKDEQKIELKIKKSKTMKTNVMTPYGNLTVKDNGEIYQNGQKLDQRDEMYDADTNLSVCISPHVNVYAKGSIYSKRVHMDDLVEKAGYVQGSKSGMKTPAILHKDHDRNNYASNNLEWVEKDSPEYVAYQKDEVEQIKKRNVELNPCKVFPDFMQPKS